MAVMGVIMSSTADPAATMANLIQASDGCNTFAQASGTCAL
jgi:hypothetical protein